MKEVRQEFNKYVFLNIMSMVGLSCFIFVDSLCVANGVGSNGLAALNLALPVYSFMNGIGLMIGIGGATRYSMDRGEGRELKAKVKFTVSCKLAFLAGVFFVILGLFCTEIICRILGADPEVFPHMVSYLRVILLFGPAFMIYNVLVAFVRNDLAPRRAMSAMLVASISNMVMDIIFVFVFHWGMFGTALATGIAPLLGIAVLVPHIVGKKCHFGLVKAWAALGDAGRVLSPGGASFITEFSSGVIMIIFNFVILKLTGSIGVAAYGVIANIALVVAAVFNGIAQGIQPVISSRYGRGKREEINYVIRHGLILAFVLGTAFYIISIILVNPLIAMFNQEQGVVFHNIAKQGILLYFFGFLPMGINIVAASACASINFSVPSIEIATARGIILPMLLILFMPAIFGMTGVWLTVTIAEFLACALAVVSLGRLMKDL